MQRIKAIGIANQNKAAVRAFGHTFFGYAGTHKAAIADATSRAAKGEHCAHIYATQVHSRIKKCIKCTGEVKEY